MAPKKGSAVKKKQPAPSKAKATRKPTTTTKNKSRKQATSDDEESVEHSGSEVEVVDETAADPADADVE